MESGEATLEAEGPAPAPAIRAPRLVLAVFTLATFLGSALVFLVQPMVAKMVLPSLGGSPAVWNTAMVFFQATLLAGYAYAHLTTRWLGLRRQAWAHAVVLAIPLLVLPIAVPAGWSPDTGVPPAMWLLFVLLVAAGAPYFVVTTSSPLLQRWFSGTGHAQAHDPYFLYAAGNVGSLLALLGYPLVVEPNLPLGSQSWLWFGGYVAFVLLSFGCMVTLVRRPDWAVASADASPEPAATSDAAAAPAAAAASAPAVTTDPVATADAATGGAATSRVATAAESRPAPLGWRTRVRWLAFAFVPSSMFLATTQFMTTDIAAVPLLWVLPLSIYLLTFILAFARLSALWVRVGAWALPFLAVALAVTFLGWAWLPVWQLFTLHLVTVFVVGVLCHGRLAEERPPPSRLTEFFLLMATGGVAGGIFNALVAPVVFTDVLEYPLVIVASLALRPALRRRGLAPERFRFVEDAALVAGLYYFLVHLVPAYQAMEGPLSTAGLWVGGALAAGAVHLLATRREALTLGLAAVLATAWVATDPLLRTDRTFFGVYQVYEDRADRHVMLHGTTVHGFQSFHPDLVDVPLSYHHPDGPIGDLYDALEGDPRLDDVGVLGLGVGTMAAYGESGQRYTFYEIDPAVIEMATDPALFTYLRDSDAEIDIVVGDGRLQIENREEARHGLLFLNAFTSDAIPVHLLTREAVVSYLDRLMPDGVLVFNVSNRYLHVEPVVAGIADELGLHAIAKRDGHRDDGEGKYASHWVLVARDRAAFGDLVGHPDWYAVAAAEDAPVWTDTFSDILSVYRGG